MNAPEPANSHYRLEPKYLSTSDGELFVLSFVPGRVTQPARYVIGLPPFAEELNKSRRMLAALGRRLASAGFCFVLPDLYGTGDSDGSFEESTWERWTSNIRSTLGALTDTDSGSFDVVALRSGAFLIPGLEGSALPRPKKIVMWSPVQRGAKMIDQMLRTKVIRESSASEVSSVATVRNEIRRANSLEVAGYRLTNNLIVSIDGLELSTLRLPHDAAIHWIDVSPAGTERVPKHVELTKSAWEERGTSVSYSRIIGPQFWMGPEIELVPDLLEQTVEILTSD